MKRILMDMSSVLWMSLLAGTDKEFGRKVPNPVEGKADVQINSAAYGFENCINHIVSVLKRFDAAPRDIVMVFDGANSKMMRQGIYSEYKAGRSHHEDSYVEFDKLREMVKETLLGLGALAVWQDAYEADDVLGYLAKNLKSKCIIDSNDGDMLVLHDSNVDVYRDGNLNENKYGPFPFRFITLYKALVGDSSDNIKGAHGFGPKTFLNLYLTFGEEGLEMMEGLIRDRKLETLAEDVGEMKALQKIIDFKDSVYMSWDLAVLYPQRINTMRKPLQIQAGMVTQWDSSKHDARLKQWYGASRIVHAGNYNEAAGWGLGKLLESDFVSFDIETSSAPESDAWLEEKSRASDGEVEGRGGVDVLGSKMTGASVTFGDNQQYSLYFTVDHVETPQIKNVTSEQVRQFMELVPDSLDCLMQNAGFELSVLHQAWGEAWKDNGCHGFIPNIQDTMLMKSYVDENSSLGLKQSSASILKYEQVSYADVTKGRKMNEMTAEETVSYGNDDTICTSALYNYYRFVMELENTWHVYESVEIGPVYLNAMRFLKGTPISLEKMNELAALDTADYDKAWTYLRDFLIAQGWQGSVCLQFNKAEDFTAASIKEAYAICNNRPLETQVRTPAKLFALMVEAGDDLLPALFATAMESGDCATLNAHLKHCFKGEPDSPTDSPKQMQKLLYETLGLPVRLRNKVTDAARAKGIKEGGARTDDLSIQFALTYDADKGEEAMEVLRSLQIMKMVSTRRKLYYKPYRYVKHWRDGLVHAQLHQCRAVTRRYSSSDPNLQQMPKHPKQGKPARFREILPPHKKNAVVVSLDFTAQELINIAEQSQDPNMLACYVGDDKKDMHALTASGIVLKKTAADLWRLMYPNEAPEGEKFEASAARWKAYTYEEFARAMNDKAHPDAAMVKVLRALGKKTNFTTEYGSQAPKLSETLIVTREEAQKYIDAKLAAFPRAEAWKKEVIAEAHVKGYTSTMMGARRHLPNLMSSNKFDVLSAERQGVNFTVQGSCAEQTKLAEGRLWDSGIFYRYDANYIGPIHDELVSSVSVEHCVDFIIEKHAAMTANYAGMKVPIISSISLGRSFGEQIEIGEVPDPEKIREALRSLGFVDSMTTA